ncbi:Hypothetical predicted protein [Mytilus galloprovincialis]|uniref:Phytanoyl-CoA hydroxylase-interacting protein-like C-terminal domain-containing protein n=1 Tax=Mytilus galloprovincialis TaxID=29158 RepID=A0A8B6D2N8_MYTGA|nr:Hypothetical predicted protein [Mytilus galloprovincialis]
MSTLEVFFRGQIDSICGQICFKVIIPNQDVDILMLFLVYEHAPHYGISLTADTSTKEHELPMNFLSGSGCSYCLEIYGLRKKIESDREFYEYQSYGRTVFQVMKGRSASNLNLNMRLSEQECAFLPVDCASKDNLQISIHHKPNSRYTFKSNQKYQSDKTWILIFKQHGEKISVFINTGKRLKFTLPFELHAARNCEIKAIIGSVLYESDVVRIIANEVNSKKLRFKSYFTKQEYQALLNRTLSFIKILPGKFNTIDYLYRNKSEMYFASIREYHSGIMKPYKKDHNGDPCSVINGNIDGLFFSTAVDFQTMKPLPESLYGPVRLHIDASTLFTPNFNLYFADFYCHYRVHYVTVVLTPKRSPTDKFCEGRLLKLDIRQNPFIYLSETKEDFYEVIVYLSNGLRVEVFYTEAVNISRIIENQQGHFERVPTIGRGESRPSGIPKNNLCKICNL